MNNQTKQTTKIVGTCLIVIGVAAIVAAGILMGRGDTSLLQVIISICASYVWCFSTARKVIVWLNISGQKRVKLLVTVQASPWKKRAT